VVGEAGISRSTFYAYFVDKTTLLRTWYAEFSQVILDAVQSWWSLDGTATKDDVRAALERIMDVYRAHPELIAATHEAIGNDHGVRQVVDDAMRRYIDGLRAHIEIGQAGGFIDPSLAAAETAYWLQWMAERGLHRMLRAELGSNQGRLAEAYARIVWNTLYAPTPPRRRITDSLVFRSTQPRGEAGAIRPTERRLWHLSQPISPKLTH